MATLSRVGMNKARHKQGQFAEQNRLSEEKKREQKEKEKVVSQEEHEERLQKLKEVGLIK